MPLIRRRRPLFVPLLWVAVPTQWESTFSASRRTSRTRPTTRASRMRVRRRGCSGDQWADHERGHPAAGELGKLHEQGVLNDDEFAVQGRSSERADTPLRGVLQRQRSPAASSGLGQYSVRSILASSDSSTGPKAPGALPSRWCAASVASADTSRTTRPDIGPQVSGDDASARVREPHVQQHCVRGWLSIASIASPADPASPITR